MFQENNCFTFPTAKINIKYALMSIMISWNNTSPFNSATYDYQFVALSMNASFGKVQLLTKDIDEKGMCFIKGKNMNFKWEMKVYLVFSFFNRYLL